MAIGCIHAYWFADEPDKRAWRTIQAQIIRLVDWITNVKKANGWCYYSRLALSRRTSAASRELFNVRLVQLLNLGLRQKYSAHPSNSIHQALIASATRNRQRVKHDLKQLPGRGAGQIRSSLGLFVKPSRPYATDTLSQVEPANQGDPWKSPSEVPHAIDSEGDHPINDTNPTNSSTIH